MHSDKNRSVEEEGHLGRLRVYRKNRVKGEISPLTLVAEALRVLYGLGFCSAGS